MKNNAKNDSSQTHIFTSFPETHNDNDDMDKLLENSHLEQKISIDDRTAENEKIYSAWQVEYYQKYFNVSTNDVLLRICGSITPTCNQSFLINRIRPNPDLYGPFWISITLIFTIAIIGNIVNFFHDLGPTNVWHTDFHKVTSAAAIILTYWWLIPIILYSLLRWRQQSTEYSFIEILCIYGYSLSIYIPISIIWLINVSFIQWIVFLIGILLSGCVLVFNFWPAFANDTNKKMAIGVISMILLLHSLLGMSFMFYFFNYKNSPIPSVITTTSTTTLISSISNQALNITKN